MAIVAGQPIVAALTLCRIAARAAVETVGGRSAEERVVTVAAFGSARATAVLLVMVSLPSKPSMCMLVTVEAVNVRVSVPRVTVRFELETATLEMVSSSAVLKTESSPF